LWHNDHFMAQCAMSKNYMWHTAPLSRMFWEIFSLWEIDSESLAFARLPRRRHPWSL
jgi:hypothetical protein